MPNFKGVFMEDQVLKFPKWKNADMVINYEETDKPGSHWIALALRDGKSFYFDSYAMPILGEVIKYLKSFIPMKNQYRNHIKCQRFSEVTCGNKCLEFLYRMQNVSTQNGFISVVTTMTFH